MKWVILTGEYPPQSGGVGDYTRLVSRELVAAGDDVHVWAPPSSVVVGVQALACSEQTKACTPTENRPADGIDVRRLPDHFGRRSLQVLDRELRELPGPFRILVQYVPHAFGRRAMNVPFCFWLSRRKEPVWVMFHEVAFPWSWRQSPKHQFLGLVTQQMARLVARSAERCFVSIPSWERFLRRLTKLHNKPTWLPVPSNLPTQIDDHAVQKSRQCVTKDPRTQIVGHFGTYGRDVSAMLQGILSGLLQQHPRCLVRLVGRNSDRFQKGFLADQPRLADRLHASGEIPVAEAAVALAGCDCLIQPYPDGVSSRRSSLMAGLGLGLPIVTNRGFLSEPIWESSGAVELLPDFTETGCLESIQRLLDNPTERLILRQKAAELYKTTFALEHTVEVLRDTECAQGSSKGQPEKAA